MKKEIEFGGIWFDETTPPRVMEIISSNLNSKRFRFWYGDSDTGKSWNEENDICGTIGRSTGGKKIPLLIHNSGSTGGGTLLTACIVKIVDTKTKRVLYQHETFNQPVFHNLGSIVCFGEEDQIYANCKTERSAKRLADFMNGNRMSK